MKILMLTSVYKDVSLGNRDSSTNIVNSFVKEWKKQGHDVLVIHNAHCYPRIIHKIPISIKNILAGKMGFAISDFEAVKEKYFIDNGVKVYRLPIKKYIPHSQPSNNKIKRQLHRILTVLKNEKFEPNVIVGHWASPQMELISLLKDIIGCQTAVVLHGTGYIASSKFKANHYLENIDFLGARSKSQAAQIKKILGLDKMPFICNSGIPDEYLDNYSLNLTKFDTTVTWKIAYVGRLVSYKNVDATIKALMRLPYTNWEFNVIGDGGSRDELEKLVNDFNCANKVHFYGRVSRDKVLEILKDTHIFVMISTNEIFGLVYLEALAASCLTIASKEGGVDGIIVDKKNGFLCKEGDSAELCNVLKWIFEKDISIIKQIVEAGYNTVTDYSDTKVAERYLQIITKN